MFPEVILNIIIFSLFHKVLLCQIQLFLFIYFYTSLEQLQDCINQSLFIFFIFQITFISLCTSLAKKGLFIFERHNNFM